MLGLTPYPQFPHNLRRPATPAGHPPRFRGNEESDSLGLNLELPSEANAHEGLTSKGHHSGKASAHGSSHASPNASVLSLSGLSIELPEDALSLSAIQEAEASARKSQERKKSDVHHARPASRHRHEPSLAEKEKLEQTGKKTSKPKHDSEDGEEPEPLEAPPQEQYDEYAAHQRLLKQLEWGKRFEPAGRAVDWMEDQVKLAGRRSVGVAHDLSESAKGLASQAVNHVRKSAANRLRRLVDVLDGDSTSSAETSSPDRH